MITLMLCLVILAMVGAAVRWGADTRDDIDSFEWERRRAWRGRW